MADTQAESPDSRTFGVGRKRDLHDPQHGESADSGDSSEEERSHKRVKTDVPVQTTYSGLGLDPDGSQPTAHQSGATEGEGSSFPALEKLRSEPSTAKLDEVARQWPGEAQATSDAQNNAVFPTTWNTGVQSGLRTSFAGKSKRRSRQAKATSLTGEEYKIDTNPTIASVPQKGAPTPLDQDELGSSDDKNDEPTNDSEVVTASQAQSLSARPAHTESHSTQTTSNHQGPRAHTLEVRGRPEDETQKATDATERDSDQPQPDSEQSESEDSKSEGNFNNTVDPVALSAGFSQSGLPEKFRPLPSREVNLLSPAAREAYRIRFKAHKAEVRERMAKRALLEETTAPRLDRAVKKLTNAELTLLDPLEQKEYLAAFEANKLERQRRVLEAVTRNATECLADPRASGRAKISSQITNGFTFYPRECSPIYHKGGVDFPLSEILHEGKPIHIDQFSFNVFAPAFLAAHRERRDVIAQNSLVKAFHLYVTSFYSHVLQFGFADRLRSTATAPDALTLEEATHLADIGTSAVSNISYTSLVTNGSDQVNSSLPVFPMGVDRPDKPNVRDGGSKRPAYGNTSGSQDANGTMIPPPTENLSVEHANIEQPMIGETQTAVDEDDSAIVDLTGTGELLPESMESMDYEVDEADMLLQQKYFPSHIASKIPRCLSCGNLGHRSSMCPALSCTTCSTFGRHSSTMCPLNIRCGKCRERGHSKDNCPEKLSRSKSEAIACDVCGSKDHLEIACQYIWRSFNPKGEEIRAVRDIPVHCYMCGESGHYGPECGLHRGRILSGGDTWSRRNLEKYLDPASRDRAVSAGVDYSIPPRSTKKFNIKGKANDPIEIDDDSDGGESFLRAKINPITQSGHIRFGRPNQQALPRKPYGDTQGFGSMQSNSGDMSYRPGSLPPNNSNRPSGPRQGMNSQPPQGQNNSVSRGKNQKTKKKGVPAQPGVKKRGRMRKGGQDRL